MNKINKEIIEESIEAWTGQKPSVSHFKIFGCICYAHIPAEKRTKLDEKSQKCIFVGYSSNTKGYRLYNLESKKLIVSRDVLFNEKACWDWSENLVQDIPLVVVQEEGNIHDEQQADEVVPSTPVSSPNTEPVSPNYSSSESPPLRTRSLRDLYENCNFAGVEPESYEEAQSDEVWVKAMEEEIRKSP